MPRGLSQQLSRIAKDARAFEQTNGFRGEEIPKFGASWRENDQHAALENSCMAHAALRSRLAHAGLET